MEYCCEKFRHAHKDKDGPIGWFGYNKTFFIALYNLTPSKKAISCQGHEFADINFCPWCGQKLRGKICSTN